MSTKRMKHKGGKKLTTEEMQGYLVTSFDKQKT